jgi:hypothetical protein
LTISQGRRSKRDKKRALQRALVTVVEFSDDAASDNGDSDDDSSEDDDDNNDNDVAAGNDLDTSVSHGSNSVFRFASIVAVPLDCRSTQSVPATRFDKLGGTAGDGTGDSGGERDKNSNDVRNFDPPACGRVIRIRDVRPRIDSRHSRSHSRCPLVHEKSTR